MNLKVQKAVMIIQGSGRVVTMKYVVLPELDRLTIAASLADEVLGEFIAQSKYLLLVQSDDPLNL